MPGATTRPAASIVSRASSVTAPTATIRPARTPTSARRPGAPVPSTTVPPLITQSSINRSYEPASLCRAWRRVLTPVRRGGGLFGGALGVGEREALVGLQQFAHHGADRRVGDRVRREHQPHQFDAVLLDHRRQHFLELGAGRLLAAIAERGAGA